MQLNWLLYTIAHIIRVNTKLYFQLDDSAIHVPTFFIFHYVLIVNSLLYYDYNIKKITNYIFSLLTLLLFKLNNKLHFNYKKIINRSEFKGEK